MHFFLLIILKNDSSFIIRGTILIVKIENSIYMKGNFKAGHKNNKKLKSLNRKIACINIDRIDSN